MNQPTAPAADGTGSHEPPLLESRGLHAGYGPASVLRDVEIKIARGQVVALLGPNGAGKTTTVHTLAGEIKPLKGEVLRNGVRDTSPLFRRARQGLAYVGEDRTVFMTLTVAENLRVARANTDHAFELFPELKRLAGRRTGLLSGGEQQMLALARVLGRGPSVLLADELSLGLAPLVVDRLLAAVRQAADERELGVLLVEQHVEKALKYADYAYVLRRGEVIIEGSGADIRGRLDEVQDSYLSVAD
ncbi:ABC transporter ATP-binding protein [Amycolatopsis alkalitolerans]|uniref:ABC transporter ATP-binding protein n=1 Tax=Amycolatopsis alkalitolerans TaxID=2547244 RepID=A0A5C4LQE8_9PSEU|nr:ABC transporter ATP-binding protein [Amycolatopsis alkalitolerans]TNC20595.1 ABC transporter ATP-binding protein [Amycolatopsis alkalitolerans]